MLRVCVRLSAAMLVVACASSATIAPKPALSAADTVSYLQARLVGWSYYQNYDDGVTTRYDSIELRGCELSVSETLAQKNGSFQVRIAYPLDKLVEIEWYPNLGESGELMMVVDDQRKLITRTSASRTTVYSSQDYLALPPEYGDRIARAVSHLHKVCVRTPEADPFSRQESGRPEKRVVRRALCARSRDPLRRGSRTNRAR
jgi:hypothetical protein